MQICSEVNDLPGVPAQDWRTIAYTVQQLCSEEVETLILPRNPPAYTKLLAPWICVQQSFKKVDFSFQTRPKQYEQMNW